MSKRVSHPVGGTRLTQDQFAHEASIGEMVNRHRLGASMHDPFATRQPIWGDFTALDFQTYQDTILDAKRAFAALPSPVRRHFGNDPYQVFRLIDQVRAGNEDAIKLAKRLDIVVDIPKPVEGTPLKADPEANPRKETT